MKTMLRNLARRWADKVMIDIADDWQMRCIRAEAAVERQAQVLRNGAQTVLETGKAYAECRTALRKAEDSLARRTAELAAARAALRELADVANQWHAGYLDDLALKRAVDAADAAGVAGPEAKP